MSQMGEVTIRPSNMGWRNSRCMPRPRYAVFDHGAAPVGAVDAILQDEHGLRAKLWMTWR